MKKCIANFLRVSEIENWKIHGIRSYVQVTIDAGECVCVSKMKEVIKEETGYNVNIDASCMMIDEKYRLLIEVYW